MLRHKFCDDDAACCYLKTPKFLGGKATCPKVISLCPFCLIGHVFWRPTIQFSGIAMHMLLGSIQQTIRTLAYFRQMNTVPQQPQLSLNSMIDKDYNAQKIIFNNTHNKHKTNKY